MATVLQIPRASAQSMLERYAERLAEQQAAKAEIAGGIKSLFGDAEADGIHPGAFKLCLKLQRMKATERCDFLRAMDQYIVDMGLDAQLDLFEPRPVTAFASTAGTTKNDQPEADPDAPFIESVLEAEAEILAAAFTEPQPIEMFPECA